MPVLSSSDFQPTPLPKHGASMPSPIRRRLRARERTMAPGIFVRSHSPYLWIRFPDHRGRKQRESTNIRFHTRGDGEAVIAPETLRKAQRRLDARRAEVSARRSVGTDERRVRFEHLADLVRRDYELRGRRSLAALEARLAALAGFFGGMRAVDITPVVIEEYQRARKAGQVAPVRRPRRDGKPGGRPIRPAANATVNRDLEVLKRAFKLARRKGLLTAAPEFPEDLSEKNNVRRGFATHRTYLDVRRHLPDDHADVLDFGYLVGWRKGQIQGLTWGAVDLADNALEVPAAINKTGEAHRLWMFPEIRAIIDRRLAKRTPGTSLVFHVDGEALGDWTARWNRACRAAGRPGLRFHDLRRTASRNLVRAGVDRKVAMSITGHQTMAMFDRYNVTADDDVRQAVGRYSAFLQAADAEIGSDPGSSDD